MSQVCGSCRHENPDAAKFCLECGAGLARACPSCGQPLVPAAKFCMECGTAVHGPSAPGSAPELPRGDVPVSERRTTTVLFGDLVSFTTLSESRDPEEVRELLSSYFALARTIVGRYGGTIEKFIGDAVMAVWGVPLSHEDDAERAVRAGLDLVTELAAMGARVGAPALAMRVGVVTGSVAVTLGAVGEGMVAGDAVNTAARVQTAADPGTVWVDQETRGLTAAAVAFTDMGEHALKGKAEPARLFRADAVVAAVGGAQRVDGLEAPMLGRDAELRQVKELFHATQADGRSRVVTVTGMAGVGKSRLGWELEKYVDGLSDGVRWHRGRCLSYGEGVAFWAFAEMMRSRLGLLEGDDRVEVEAKVREGVALHAPGDESWLVPRLGALFSGTSTFDRTDLFAAWTTFLDRVGGDRPVILLFEDVQHADSGLLDLVRHLLETSRARLLVVLLTRPELLEEHPELAATARGTVLTLEPLPAATMDVLVDALVEDLPARVRAAVVARSEGVPLYAVETVRSLVDRDAVVARGGRYVFVDHDNVLVDLDQLAAPTSLQTLIAARLDALTPLERRTVQDASVLGMAFPLAALVAVTETPEHVLSTVLATLVAKGVLLSEEDPRSPERGQLRFQQALVREVAYSTLTRKDRRSRHLRVADRLEAEGGGSAEALAGVVAQHLVDALAASQDQDPERPVILTRARTSLVTAATRAEGLGSPEEALQSTLTALDLQPGPDELEVARLLERAARLAVASGSGVRGEDLAARAVAGYERLGLEEDAVRSLELQVRALRVQGRSRELIALATEADRRSVAVGQVETPTRFDLQAALAFATRGSNDLDAQVRHTMTMLRIAEELQDPAALGMALNYGAIMLLDVGSRTAYTAMLDQGIELARSTHTLGQLGRSLANLLSQVYQRDLVRAGELAEEAVEVNRRVGDAYVTEATLTNAAFTWWLAGDWDRLLSEAAAWLDEREARGTSGGLWVARHLVARARGQELVPARVLESDDQFDENARVLAESLLRSAGGEPGPAAAAASASATLLFGDRAAMEDFELLWPPVVELALEAGDVAGARALLGLADPVLGGRGSPLGRAEVARLRGMVALAAGQDPEADLRQAVAAHEAYGAPYLLARCRHELGRWLLGQGRASEAALLLDQARTTYVGLGAAPGLADLDALGATAGQQRSVGAGL